MILRRVRIEGYQTLRNPIELAGLGVGLHLLHGPNETGKSTVIAAIARAFFDRYSTADQEIKRLRPWGTELGPRVLLEFETGGKGYRLEKRFLDEESSALSEWNGSRFERMADSVKADDQVRELLQATAAKVGASDLKNWGMARLLWMTQNADRLSPPELDITIRQKLLSVLGSAVLSPGEQALLARLDQEYEIYYTAAKQAEKKGSPLAESRERLERANKDLEFWKSKWDQATYWNETVSTAEQKVERLARERVVTDQAFRELRLRSEKELELENRIKLKEQELLLAQGRWKTVSALQAELAELQSAAVAKEREALELEPRAIQSVAELKTTEVALEQAVAGLQKSAAEATALSQRMANAGLGAELRSLRRQSQDLRTVLANATSIERERLAKGEEYLLRRRPKEREVQEALSQDQEIQALGKRIEDLGIEVQVLPENAGLEVTWEVAGAPAHSTSLRQGETEIFRSADAGVLIIPGFGRIQVRSGAEDSRLLKIRLAEFKSALAARFAAFGVSSLGELATLRAETAVIEAEGTDLRKALESTIGPRYKTLAELKAESERVALTWSRKLEQSGLTESELDQAEAPELEVLSASLKSARNAQGADEALKTRLEAELRQRRVRADELRASLDSARQAAVLLRGQLDQKLVTAGGRERLLQELQDVLQSKNAVEAECQIYLKQLLPVNERASTRVSAQEKKLEDDLKAEQLARQELDRASAVLQNAQGEGYYSKLAAAEEEHALAADVLRASLARAQGAKVLRRLALTKRERMNSGLMSPVEAAVSRIFDEIRGPSASTLRFGSDVHEIGIQTPSSHSAQAGPTAGLTSLSLGAREQAMLAVRLAFGELLSSRGEKPEPQLIVLDDPLVNADPARQERARAILRKASETLQILILTARPEDYRMLSPKEYDLAALKAGSST